MRQQDLSDKTKLSLSDIKNVERGRTKSGRVVDSIASAFNVTREELLNEPIEHEPRKKVTIEHPELYKQAFELVFEIMKQSPSVLAAEEINAMVMQVYRYGEFEGEDKMREFANFLVADKKEG